MTKYWRVSFFADGRVNRVRAIKGPGHPRWVVVEAEDEEQAKRKAYNLYCARKKKERTTQCHAAGKCVCGRPQDRACGAGARKGQWAKTCSVCAERSHVYHENSKARPARTFEQSMAERDENARIASNLERQRDRRAEIRLETLVEVRTAWQESSTVGVFSKWLAMQIQALGKVDAAQ